MLGEKGYLVKYVYESSIPFGGSYVLHHIKQGESYLIFKTQFDKVLDHMTPFFF
jgi:hypothetical protein